MKDRPILFSGPMVNAIREGRKRMTRRICKLTDSGRVRLHGARKNWHPEDTQAVFACPYGQPGDRLWVKETHMLCENCACLNYAADKRNCKHCDATLDGPKRPSIYMPRWASRILLEITAVRIDRLEDISEEDTKAEGIEAHDDDGVTYYGPYGQGNCCPVEAFKTLWESINGPGSWEANPWVWVIEFRVLEGSK